MLPVGYLFVLTIAMAGARGEVIANKKIVDKKFNVWNVSCEEDEMLGNVRCVMFVEVTVKTIVFVNPYNSQKILLVSKDGYSGRSFFVKVDNNVLITSKPLLDGKDGIVNFDERDIENLFRQISEGNNFYMRFSVGDDVSPDGFREVTIKFSLAEFQKAFTYYTEQLNKYHINNTR
ncbi:MAG: hypothetical protein LBB13_00570 [Rickettsiales bacterium]|jgi:hypothetical protein|nr:hypothetical protein [Rickettsiales bacterium]